MKYGLYSYNKNTGRYVLLCESKNKKAVHNEAKFLQAFEKNAEKFGVLLPQKLNKCFQRLSKKTRLLQPLFLFWGFMSYYIM